MKKILLLSSFFIFAFYTVNAQLYADFEEVSPLMNPFSPNNDFFPAVAENPLINELNPSDSVYGGECATGTWEGMWFDLEEPIDFTNSFTFTMLVYGESTGVAMLKIESPSGGGPAIENPMDYTDEYEWQKITYTFDGFDADVSAYSRLAVFLDFGSEETGNLWYFDSLIGPAGYEGTGINALNNHHLIYTNPFKNQLHVKSTSTLNKVSVFNLMGQEVLSVNNINSSSINLETSNLKNGIYFMKTKDVTGQTSSSKLIKR